MRGDTAEGDDPVVERARVRVGGDGGVRQSALSLTKVHFTFVPSKVLRGLLQIRVGEAGDGREESRRFLIKARSSFEGSTCTSRYRVIALARSWDVFTASRSARYG